MYPRNTPHNGTRIGMATSRIRIDLSDPKVDDIHLEDIIFQMTRIPRYNGATLTSNLWSVGDHLRMCKSIYRIFCGEGFISRDPEIESHIMLHDAAEIYTGDLVTPFKRLLQDLGELKSYKSLTNRLDDLIRIRFGLRKLNAAESITLKDVDLYAFEVECAMHRPVYRENVVPNKMTVELLKHPDISRFTKTVPLETGWRLLFDEFEDTAKFLQHPAMREALADCINPYESGILEEQSKRVRSIILQSQADEAANQALRATIHHGKPDDDFLEEKIVVPNYGAA